MAGTAHKCLESASLQPLGKQCSMSDSITTVAGRFNESVIKIYTRQILIGLEYLHGNNIMHRDIKGANILVDNTGLVKLADFGASRKIENLATIGELIGTYSCLYGNTRSRPVQSKWAQMAVSQKACSLAQSKSIAAKQCCVFRNCSVQMRTPLHFFSYQINTIWSWKAPHRYV